MVIGINLYAVRYVHIHLRSDNDIFNQLGRFLTFTAHWNIGNKVDCMHSHD